ncbi:hypothetical protein GCM10010388_21950 [Streptomyces mauvecolor]
MPSRLVGLCAGGEERRLRGAADSATGASPSTYRIGPVATMWRQARPPRVSTSRISCVAYATEDSGAEAKIGSASRLESRVSPGSSLRTARPITMRWRAPVTWNTA